MIEALQEIDQILSLAINQAYNASADQLMIIISDKKTWIPLYLLLLLLINKIFGWKRALLITVAIVINLTLTDQISVMMKEFFLRLRPCHEPGFQDLLHLPDGCGGKFGFVSSHAANTMGLAALVSLILKNRWMTLGMLAYAFANSYSRVYLGKHYLFDVIGGMVLGLLLAMAVYKSLRWAIKRFKL